ncbi:TPA: type II toxin-antitoxin system PemK/MazF family toxin [Bacillus cereus]|nr:PemK family of DNA-binding protein [Bacillus cereus AH1272]EEL90285.1 PemK family of DNA-binding protein [Bacillus cereus AH1273]KXI45993.1 PemK family transcriptional regulator [Bacillus cereus]HDX9501202.1 type II toxin-antitoxin system PemK/MazF family toxin [Bacillus thuringiensis]HDR4353875.1 type II toxin-antitoxin system PemK/MazF family toxin [Bacillus cereus]
MVMEKQKYNEQSALNEQNEERLKSKLNSEMSDIKNISSNKAISLLGAIPTLCKLHFDSIENRKVKNANPEKTHPIIPERGEIYNAEITVNIGSELSGNHLVVILQNNKGNMYGEKVNVLPIEGDGNKINPKYQCQLTNDDLEEGHLDKNPSRIIITDITTFDKARLGIRIGKIKPEKMMEISEMLKKQLVL